MNFMHSVVHEMGTWLLVVVTRGNTLAHTGNPVSSPDFVQPQPQPQAFEPNHAEHSDQRS